MRCSVHWEVAVAAFCAEDEPATTACWYVCEPATTAFCTAVLAAAPASLTGSSANAIPAGAPSNKPPAINPTPVGFATRRLDRFAYLLIANPPYPRYTD